MIVAKEAANLLQAVVDLLRALTAGEPLLEPLLKAGTRITVDSIELAILISIIDHDGRGTPMIAIAADPSDRQTFGAVGIPLATDGLYRPATPEQTH